MTCSEFIGASPMNRHDRRRSRATEGRVLHFRPDLSGDVTDRVAEGDKESFADPESRLLQLATAAPVS